MKHIQKWVKKSVSIKEYNTYYKYNSSYCFLRKEDKRIWLGFLVADFIPENCELLTDEEAIRVDEYRNGANIYPRPLTVLT